MRFLLALLLFAGCSYVGFAKAGSVKRRLDVVEGFLLDIRQLSISMRYRMTPIRELIGQLEASALKEFWEDLLSQMGHSRPLGDAWREALQKMRGENGDFSYLTDEEARVLSDFGASLGTSDFQAQKANMEMALERLAMLAEALRREVSQKGKIYRSLGMLGGLAAAIVVW